MQQLCWGAAGHPGISLIIFAYAYERGGINDKNSSKSSSQVYGLEYGQK